MICDNTFVRKSLALGLNREICNQGVSDLSTSRINQSHGVQTLVVVDDDDPSETERLMK